MADPRRLAVRKALVAALRAIPGVASGSVYRDPIDLTTLPQNNLPALVLGETVPLDREWQRGAQEGGRSSLSWFMDTVVMTLYAAVDAAGDGDGPADDASELMLAAIEQALTPDDYTFGGLVNDLKLRQPQSVVYGLPNNQRVILWQEMEVSMYRQYGVP